MNLRQWPWTGSPGPRDPRPANRDELFVLSLIGGGLLVVLLAIIAGLFGWFESKVNQPLPNWAENVLVAVATACSLKLGDVLAVLAALAAGRQSTKQTETLGKALADSVPSAPALPYLPPDANAAAAAGARQATEAAGEVADELAGQAPETDEGKAP